ncbi:DUF533 domain-containing protein [Pseudoruegeria sp. SK021]|uniref:DUF533 domain-containing protein n=1 Tax=Pseudoruegeria sp. SK021 TaxID=1933035 RepID=UPI000A21F9E1|nr:DUF533 domain-containing protein [Pseudoruegeria sp. SK021]OSP55226.1 hypothetical protein BV911_08310 [Pseudoruegeria sp. SK021]
MSFMKTLATLAAGVAAAKGMDKYKQMGGMSGMQEMFKGMSGPGGAGGMTDQIGQMAEKLGIPGGSKAVSDMLASFGLGGASTGGTSQQAGAAGLGGLMSAMTGAAAAGGQQADNLLDGLFKNTPVSMAAEDNAKLMIRAMIQAAKADGEIDKDEQAKILEALKDAPADEVAYVKAQLAAPVDVMALAKDATGAAKAQVYSTSLLAIKVDSPVEVAYLKQLSQALGLSDEARNQVHAAMGLPPLPA